jgi:hypothetical protein
MSKYIIKYQKEIWFDLEVEAENEKQALEMFHAGEVEFGDAEEVGQEIQENILVEQTG